MSEEILKRTFSGVLTDFPGADEPWLEEKARAISKELLERFGPKLEWGQVVTLPSQNGIGLALLFARGLEHDMTIPQTIFEVVCDTTGIPRKGRGRGAKRKDLPCFGLGPRFPPEYFESRGRIRDVSRVIHSKNGTGKR